MFCVGVALLILSKTVFDVPGVSQDNNQTPVYVTQPTLQPDYETLLSEKLEAILSLVDGAGDVKVFLTFKQGAEKVPATDVSEDIAVTEEKDVNGGTRTVNQQKTDEKTVTVKSPDGSEAPFVLKEYRPQIEGAIIVAKGGDNAFIRDALIKAASASLGIEPHKVSVLKMK